MNKGRKQRMKEGMNEGRKEGRKEQNIDTDIHITDFLQGMLFIIKYYKKNFYTFSFIKFIMN